MLSTTAPSNSPQDPTGVALNSRTISLSWSPPPVENQNGIIREYRVNITELETERSWQLVSTSTSIDVLSLHPYYTYEWIVAAVTVDEGPYTQTSILRTPEDGKLCTMS